MNHIIYGKGGREDNEKFSMLLAMAYQTAGVVDFVSASHAGHLGKAVSSETLKVLEDSVELVVHLPRTLAVRGNLEALLKAVSQKFANELKILCAASAWDEHKGENGEMRTFACAPEGKPFELGVQED